MSTTAKVVKHCDGIAITRRISICNFAYVDHSNKAKERMLNEQKQEQKKSVKKKCRKEKEKQQEEKSRMS